MALKMRASKIVNRTPRWVKQYPEKTLAELSMQTGLGLRVVRKRLVEEFGKDILPSGGRLGKPHAKKHPPQEHALSPKQIQLIIERAKAKISPLESAEEFGVHVATIRRELRRNGVPPFKGRGPDRKKRAPYGSLKL